MSDKQALARIKRLQKEMEKFETDPPPGCEEGFRNSKSECHLWQCILDWPP